jgi:hypothetical protein
MYKLYKSFYTNEVVGAMKIDGGIRISFLFDPANTDHQAYLAWVEAGNTPLPPDDQTGQNTPIQE